MWQSEILFCKPKAGRVIPILVEIFIWGGGEVRAGDILRKVLVIKMVRKDLVICDTRINTQNYHNLLSQNRI